MAAVASERDLPGGRLNEIVDATNWLWWFTDNGVLPGPNLAMADSGIMVSCDVDTAAPADELDLPLAAMALVAALRMDASASELVVSVDEALLIELVDVDVDVEVEVVVVALVDVAPPAVPPDLLT